MLKKMSLQHLLVAFFSIMTIFVIPACNTMEGAGRDIERGGEKLQDAADSARR
jgi:entericidin B